MLPRRRNVGGVSDRTSLIENEDSYSKLDKKGLSYTKPYAPLVNTQQNQRQFNSAEQDIVFDFLEDFDFEPVMAARDRTNEFAAAVRSLQGRTLVRPVVRDDRRVAILETYTQFMSMAKVISKNITSTYAKLEKLALCKLLYLE